MKSTIHLRLSEYITKKKIQKRNLCEQLEINHQSLYNYLKGTNKMTIDVLENFVKLYPNININWLFNGNGPMENDPENMMKEPRGEYGQCPECKAKENTIKIHEEHISLLQQDLLDCRKKLQGLQKHDSQKRKAG